MKLAIPTTQCMAFLFFFVVNFGVGSTELASLSANVETRVVQKKPYHSPFESYEAFIGFMKESKFANPPWSDQELRSAFPETTYHACFEQEQTRVQEVLYQSPNGITRGWVVKPHRSKKNKLPIVVYNRGGFAKWGRIVPFELVSLCRVAAQGYAVVASDFRGIDSNNEKHDKTDLGYGDVHDSFYLIDAISKEYSNFDTEHIAVWGFSRGTTISLMMAAQSDAVRMVILHGMVTDLVNDARRAEFDEHVYPLLVEGYESLPKAQQDELLRGITPSFLIDQIKGDPSFVIFHGAKDVRTSAEEALVFASRLLKRGHSVEFHLYPDSGHSLTGDYNEYLNEVMDALRQRL